MKYFRFPVLFLLASAFAGAATISGSVAFTDTVFSYVGADLASATSITLLGSNGVVQFDSGGFMCPAPDCTPLGSLMVFDATTFAVPLPALYFINWGDGGAGPNATRYGYYIYGASTASTGPNELTLITTGEFQDSLGEYAYAPATLIFSLTQAGGPGNSISGSGTVEVQGEVPEPDMALLVGSVCVFLGLIGRRRLAMGFEG